MSLDEDHPACGQRKMKARRSMDIEFHDHLDDDFFSHFKDLDDDTSHKRRSPRRFDDWDETSFGEATDKCEPDQEYMDQVLEVYHPERLNLLEREVPEEVYNKAARRAPPPLMRSVKQATLQQDDDVPSKRPGKKALLQRDDDSHSEGETSSSTSNSKQSDLSGTLSDGNDSTHSEDCTFPQLTKQSTIGRREKQGAISTTTDESESITEEDNEETFAKSPETNDPRLGVDRAQLLCNMGRPTNKSLRTINGTFWAKPFKGLAQSMRRTGNTKGVADS